MIVITFCYHQWTSKLMSRQAKVLSLLVVLDISNEPYMIWFLLLLDDIELLYFWHIELNQLAPVIHVPEIVLLYNSMCISNFLSSRTLLILIYI